MLTFNLLTSVAYVIFSLYAVFPVSFHRPMLSIRMQSFRGAPSRLAALKKKKLLGNRARPIPRTVDILIFNQNGGYVSGQSAT